MQLAVLVPPDSEGQAAATYCAIETSVDSQRVPHLVVHRRRGTTVPFSTMNKSAVSFQHPVATISQDLIAQRRALLDEHRQLLAKQKALREKLLLSIDMLRHVRPDSRGAWDLEL